MDVGGGQGGFLLEVLRGNPGLRGVLFDNETVLPGNLLGELPAERWELAAGDFFDALPAGGHIYAIKRVLHDWSDEECVQILRNCRRAMDSDGRVLVVEAVAPPGNDPHPAKTADMLLMMVVTGQERTEPEFARLFTAAGLRLARVIPTPSAMVILEAVAV